MRDRRFRVKSTEEFKAARYRIALKQTDLVVGGLTQPQISRLELGKCAVSEHQAKLLALLLKTPMNWVFEEEDKVHGRD